MLDLRRGSDYPCHAKHTRIYNLMREMKSHGLVVVDGRGKDKRYVINPSSGR